jgi:restriction system protein
MPVPDYQTFMLPVLAYAGKHASEAVAVKELYDAMAAQFSLTDAERNELLPSGSQTTFANRVGWAATYMKKAGLLCSPKRGHIQITELGKQALVSKPTTINTAFLKNYPSFVAFQGKHKTDAADDNGADSEPVSKRTPHEILESGYQSLRSELATELLQRVKESSPAFFERLVVELLLKMGYGGSRADAGKALGKSGDGGIDGIIKEDRLGLDFIFIQAKCWTDKPVGRPDVQQFAGALAGHGATKGIFITTTQFTKEATSYAAGLRNSKIVLIDGEDLADLMIDHGIGVATAATYDVKRLDSDYFIESE